MRRGFPEASKLPTAYRAIYSTYATCWNRGFGLGSVSNNWKSPMFSNELEFVAQEWARLAVERAEPLGLPDRLLAREFLVQAMSILTRSPAEKLRPIINDEMAKAQIV